MARVTIEDCLKYVDNMYELVHLATKRARQLYKGSDPLVKSKNRVIVTALREIAAGRVTPILANQPGQQTGDDDLPPMSN
jgi:DNA-directed RNA polymerase subunit omega